jgi:hypothetical protein
VDIWLRHLFPGRIVSVLHSSSLFSTRHNSQGKPGLCSFIVPHKTPSLWLSLLEEPMCLTPSVSGNAVKAPLGLTWLNYMIMVFVNVILKILFTVSRFSASNYQTLLWLLQLPVWLNLSQLFRRGNANHFSYHKPQILCERGASTAFQFLYFQSKTLLILLMYQLHRIIRLIVIFPYKNKSYIDYSRPPFVYPHHCYTLPIPYSSPIWSRFLLFFCLFVSTYEREHAILVFRFVFSWWQMIIFLVVISYLYFFFRKAFIQIIYPFLIGFLFRSLYVLDMNSVRWTAGKYFLSFCKLSLHSIVSFAMQKAFSLM